MNQNHPSFSTYFAPYDEALWSTAKTSIHDEALRSSEAQARKDLRDSSIIGRLTGQFGVQRIICAQKHSFPGGVTFTFNPFSAPHTNVGCSQYCNCAPTSQPSSLNSYNYPQSSSTLVNTFFPSSIDYSQYEYYSHHILPPTNQYQLKFHQDRSTTTSDLANHRLQIFESSGYPGERLGILENALRLQDNLTLCQKVENSSSTQLSFPTPQMNYSSCPRKLHLRKPTQSPINLVVDSLVENQERQPKQVSFADLNERPSFKDESSQVSSRCICDKNYKTKSKPEKVEDVNNSKGPEKKKKKQRANKSKCKPFWKCSDESWEDSSESSDSQDKKGNKKEKRGFKKKSTSNNASENESQSTTSDHTESGSESGSRYCSILIQTTHAHM
ncbi:uncharacterized protein [Euwallacea fornicatus]|uniref:uncharacterized protein isoform X3 n=1 Tax=Euwallacea fornicatus TaxID=995702 RepID=UPI00338EC5E2